MKNEKVKLFYINWYPKEFAYSTKTFLPEEKGIYRELLDYQCINGIIPHDPQELALICGYDQARFDTFWIKVSRKFDAVFLNKKIIGFFNKKMRLEIEKVQNVSKVNSENAKKRQQAIRKAKSEECDRSAIGSANEVRIESDRSAIKELRVKSKEREDISLLLKSNNSLENEFSSGLETSEIPEKIKVLIPVEAKIPFIKFWEQYPKKVDKSKAEKSWSRINFEEQKKIILMLPVFRKSMADRESSKILHPTTFLNGERWNDELDPVKSSSDAPKQALSPKSLAKLDLLKKMESTSTPNKPLEPLFMRSVE